MSNFRVFILIAFFAVVLEPISARGVQYHSYFGRDRLRWVDSEGAAASVSAGPSAALYAGGEYDISIAKTVVDAAGNVYIIGAQRVTVGGNTAPSVFVTKIDPTGATVYITRMGGKGSDVALGIAVDGSGGVFGAGYTTSPDFPLLNAMQVDPYPAGGTTGFVFSLDASGVLLWSTYFGGHGVQLMSFGGGTGNSVKAVAADSSGNVYVTGTSGSPDFPVTPGAFQTNGHFTELPTTISRGFVAKLSGAGQLVYATWLGGTMLDCNDEECLEDGDWIDAGTAIAVDSAGDAYVAGYTDSLDFPVTSGAFLTSAPQICQPNTLCDQLQYFNAFLSKIKPDGSGLIYSTFLGSLGDSGLLPQDGTNKGLVLDSAGDAYVAFATTGYYAAVTATGAQTMPQGGSDVLLLAVNPPGSALKLSTYLGGSGDESVTGLAVDESGNIYISGSTSSTNFPDSYGLFPAGIDFVTELDPGADEILFSARFPSGLAAQDLAAAPGAGGALITAGLSGHVMRMSPFAAASIPAVLGAGNAANGSIDSGVLLSVNELVSIYGNGIGPAMPVSGLSISLGGVQVSLNGNPAELLYTAANQINLQTPLSFDAASPVVLKIVNNGVTLGPFAIGAASVGSVPGIFRNADGTAAALNQDGTVNSASNPAHAGQIISLWGTGIPGIGGSESPTVSLSAGYTALPIVYAGPAPGLIGGVFQINAQLPQVAEGPAPIYLTAGEVSAPPVAIYMTQ